MSVLVVVPTLDEGAHVEVTVRSLLDGAGELDVRLVVADGGSTDGTVETVERLSAEDARVSLLPNPARLQSAAVNLATSAAPPEVDVVVRADCHSGYPEGWLARLVGSLHSRRDDGCVSVVVPMRTVGITPVQRAIAGAQNSFVGNGGSLHRNPDVESQYVDHGHHAAFDRTAYEAAGGYDETMATNEDAELDERLRSAGGRIYLDSDLLIDYFPRESLRSLFEQYISYGRGRYTTWKLHGTKLKARQMAPLGVTGLLAGTVLAAPVEPLLAVPAGLYAAGCFGAGVVEAAKTRDPAMLLLGPAAVVSHVAWGIGFLNQAARGLQEGVGVVSRLRVPDDVGDDVVTLPESAPVNSPVR